MDIISGDVVSEQRHQHILRVLIASPIGTWMAWTLNPDAPDDRAYCAILFYYGCDDLGWHRLAIFNRKTL
ncbi:hypothetical protein [Hyalangium sp.]|uniref:hypothetical protein n=1 Tax=Hyalangium sp. TaxID=2028555 RepID=UPI002D33E460|nr:hypothetical protein [Hyalangium sp.]HYH99779.1 hypothetical protein [Hyalangium sp.]